MENKRRSKRVTCEERVLVGFDGSIVKAQLLDISIKGAFLEFENDVTFQHGDLLNITLLSDNSDVIIQIESEVMHRNNNLVGVKFINIDLNSIIHLRSFIDIRSMTMEQIAEETEYLLS